MGRTSKPLTLRVDPSLLAHPKLQELATQGHTITPLCETCLQADAILGPTAWRLALEDARHIDLMVKGVRASLRRP